MDSEAAAAGLWLPHFFSQHLPLFRCAYLWVQNICLFPCVWGNPILPVSQCVWLLYRHVWNLTCLLFYTFFLSTLSFYKWPALIHMSSSYSMLSKVKYLDKSSKTYYSFMTNFSLQLGKVLCFYHISFSRVFTQDSLVSVSLKSYMPFRSHKLFKNLLIDIIVQIFEFSSSLTYLDLLDYILLLRNICNFICC